MRLHLVLLALTLGCATEDSKTDDTSSNGSDEDGGNLLSQVAEMATEMAEMSKTGHITPKIDVVEGFKKPENNMNMPMNKEFIKLATSAPGHTAAIKKENEEKVIVERQRQPRK